LQFWPRKRASRIYANVNWSPAGGRAKPDVKPLGFAAWKAGMTHIHMTDARPNSPTQNKIVWRPVTVLDSPPVLVLGYRVYNKSLGALSCAGEIWADSIPKDLELVRKTMPSKKKTEINVSKAADVRLIIATQPKKSGMDKKKPDVLEIGISGNEIAKKIEFAKAAIGKELSVADALKAGEWLDATGVTKGHGFEGPVKRYGIRIQNRKDKQMNRHPGSIGSTTPRKVSWRVPMAGQYGFFTRTEFNKKLIMIGEDGSKINPAGGFMKYGLVPKTFLLIEGSVPGPSKRLIVLRKAVRPQRKEVPIDIKYISLASKQGVK
jgi:large subunit ribosomal protein L3